MSALIWALACAAVAGASLPAPGPGMTRTRLTRLLSGRPLASGPACQRGSPSAATADPSSDLHGRRSWTRWSAAAAAGMSCAVLLGGLVGLLVGMVTGVVCGRVLSRLEPRERRVRRARIAADLPVAIDLLAACLRGGTAWPDAATAVATALGGPLGDELREVADRVRLGADPATAWMILAREPALVPLARAAARAANSGAPIAPTLTRLAQDQRRAAGAAAAARARAAGVRAVVPLGLCFLPAFVLLGIVPAIAGMAADMLLR